ncbi:hypothetical protein [Streptomyces sparsogenes]|uniref:WD repeat-containing protein n=1 Tax=Streptomyces sparsogenes DSM 40356 TaxID=1331668 RepID=A0A1R1SNF0_9ACTN|nr:hypothetical protein [Streptomyces sparsogenes]OMI39519.1 WD repeat-containing protein [Streptomyces sparsogenes DSM 40356]
MTGPPPYDTVSNAGAVRALVDRALSEDEIRDLCFDHYPEVYRELAAAMSRRECIRRLVAWCHARQQLGALVARVAELNAEAVAAHADALASAPRDPGPRPVPAARSLTAGVIHALPPAPSFVGRADELAALDRFWRDDGAGVLALLGLGGAGKTALAGEFLARLRAGEADPPPDELFIWSFYLNQDVKEFLEVAYTYFSGGAVVRGSPTGTFYLLAELLAGPGRRLLVLDGLERVQRPCTDRQGAFGDLSDRLLAQVIDRLADGLGGTKCLITSRLPLPRLTPWQGRGYAWLDIDQLSHEDAVALVRGRGVRGDDDALHALVDEFGAHALTLDHLSGYLVEYAAGDPARAASLPEPRADSGEPQERRLARVLDAYETVLSERESALLARLCIFRFGASAEQLHSVFACSASAKIAGPLRGLDRRDILATLRHLLQLHLVMRESAELFTVHPAVRDHFYRSFTDPRSVHQAVRRHYSALVAGPGVLPPDHPETLDLLEELVHHSLAAGHVAEAEEVYRLRMGGYEHLAWQTGQYSRCVRVLEEFPVCPDPGGLLWCYRAIGDLPAALSRIDPDDTWWLAMIGTLRGRHREVAGLLRGNRHDPILAVARALTGGMPVDRLAGAPVWFGLPLSPAECLLEAGLTEPARAYVSRAREALAAQGRDAVWNDELARYDLIEAALECDRGDLVMAQSLLEAATQWIVTSGSQEHLCLLHLGRARLARAQRHHALAASALGEGLRTAEQCGFGLYHLALLLEKAELALDTDEPDTARDAATAALAAASDPACHDILAMARARRLLSAVEQRPHPLG